MYKKKKQKKKNIILVSIAIGIACLSLSFLVLQKKQNLSVFEAMIKDSGLFIQKVILKPFHFFKVSLSNREIDELKIKANASEALEAKNKELEFELSELKKILNLNTILSDRLYLNATVINRNMDYWYHTITIDKGKHNGVEKNMPVIVSEGLIGTISDVSNFNSTVQLLTVEELSQKISVKIEIGDHYVYGLLTGYYNNSKTFKIEGIADNTEIPIGSLVTTTGLGENMPAGIVIGSVKNITKDHFELARLVEVESKVNFNSLDYVTILKRKETET